MDAVRWIMRWLRAKRAASIERMAQADPRTQASSVQSAAAGQQKKRAKEMKRDATAQGLDVDALRSYIKSLRPPRTHHIQ